MDEVASNKCKQFAWQVHYAGNYVDVQSVMITKGGWINSITESGSSLTFNDSYAESVKKQTLTAIQPIHLTTHPAIVYPSDQ